MVKRQYNEALGGLMRGIGVVNLVHTDGKECYLIDYRVYAHEADGKTKNNHFREMLINAVANRQSKDGIV